MSKPAEPLPLEIALADALALHKIHLRSIDPFGEWRPVRDEWHFAGALLPGRAVLDDGHDQERSTTARAVAFHGHSNASDVMQALQDAGINVVAYRETASVEVRARFARESFGLALPKPPLLGLSFGRIDVSIELEIVEIRQWPVPAVPRPL